MAGENGQKKRPEKYIGIAATGQKPVPLAARGIYLPSDYDSPIRACGDAHRAHPSLIGAERVYLCGRRERAAEHAAKERA